MSTNTTNLALYKADPLTDKDNTFNIKTMLNDNWDKIDAKTKSITDSVDLANQNIEKSKIFQDDSIAKKYEFGFNNGQLYYREVTV
ncbi:hypothetical protein [Clostridium estertheticum]|uniref:hypothetical protein n=1 Tax=Clostridium estertheticum TaxID=238834 RepID=UPI00124C5A6A|nr:hypothetical protein [Clostridium estertheticum]MBZ9615283.1 hypothetical protein [Clostridium estertheticum subsp. laramiense]WAG75172.1 hypothetical protein LL032_06905 [Clostridium estertheticum]